MSERSERSDCTLDALVGLFDVIYADPPWRYSFSKSRSRDIENQYPTMTIDDICALRVPAAADCVLYLWATAPKLEEALRVVQAWGFTYKTHAAWDKERIGMGYWFRGQHELLLVATRGRVSPPPQGTRTGSVLRFRRGRHSAKPDQVRDMIAAWFPDARRLEMFARERTEGWTVWGNEVDTAEQRAIQQARGRGEEEVRKWTDCMRACRAHPGAPGRGQDRAQGESR